MLDRRLGAAERRGFQQRILKGFLLRAELLGWVSKRGWCMASHKRAAMSYWAAVLHLQDAIGVAIFEDAFFDQVNRIDPVKVARGRHVELCGTTRLRAPAAAAGAGADCSQREGWMA